MKREFTVYRVDYATGKKEPIGYILERRERERGNNLLDLLGKARKIFGRGPSDAFRIVLDAPRDSRKIIGPVIIRGSRTDRSTAADPKNENEEGEKA